MNALRRLLLALTLLTASFAAEPQQAVPPVKVDYKDAFLQLALEKAKTYTGAVETAISKAVDVVATESPKLLEEWLKWRFWYHLLHCVIPLSFIALFGGIAWWGNGNWSVDDALDGDHHSIRKVGAGGCCALACIFTFFSLFVDDPPSTRNAERGHVYSLIQVVVAPRVYAVESAIQLMKR